MNDDDSYHSVYQSPQGRVVVRISCCAFGIRRLPCQRGPEPNQDSIDGKTCSVGPELGVHSGHRRRRRRSAGGAGGASADSAGSCTCQASADPETDSRPSVRGYQIKEGVLEAYVGLAAQRVGSGEAFSFFLDGNGDCPARLGPALLERARVARRDRGIEAVIARCEYEAWFVASIECIAGSRTLSWDMAAPPAARIRPRRQGMAQPAHAGSLPTDHRSAGTDRTLRHGNGAPACAVVRQDVARGKRAVGSSLRTAGRCGTLHDDEPLKCVCVAG